MFSPLPRSLLNVTLACDVSSSCMVDGVVVPELNETVGDGGESDSENIPRPSDVSVEGAGSAKDRCVDG